MWKRLALLSVLGLTVAGLVWAQAASRKADPMSAQEKIPGAATMAGKYTGPIILQGDCFCVERVKYCTRWYQECDVFEPAILVVGVDEPTPIGPHKISCHMEIEVFMAGACERG